MKQLVLTLNAGSSSLKASLMEGGTRHMSCLAEMLGTVDSAVHMIFTDEDDIVELKEANLSHEKVLNHIVFHLRARNLLKYIAAIGHRVVHGGTLFSDSTIIDELSLQQLDSIEHLAPLYVQQVSCAG